MTAAAEQTVQKRAFRLARELDISYRLARSIALAELDQGLLKT